LDLWYKLKLALLNNHYLRVENWLRDYVRLESLAEEGCWWADPDLWESTEIGVNQQEIECMERVDLRNFIDIVEFYPKERNYGILFMGLPALDQNKNPELWEELRQAIKKNELLRMAVHEDERKNGSYWIDNEDIVWGYWWTDPELWKIEELEENLPGEPCTHEEAERHEFYLCVKSIRNYPKCIGRRDLYYILNVFLKETDKNKNPDMWEKMREAFKSNKAFQEAFHKKGYKDLIKAKEGQWWFDPDMW
jgi:hypothetical protein